MKTIRCLFACLCISFTACQLDNFDGPNASVYGSIIDAETGELVAQELGTSGDAPSVQVIEYGYAIRKVQKWKIKINGEYRNDLVFSGTYDIIMNDGNYVKLDTIKAYSIKEGSNQLDFRVIPNVRIKNASISNDDNKIIANCNLEYGHEIGKVEKVSLFIQADQYPSYSFYLVRIEKNIEEDNINFDNNKLNSDKQFSLVLDLSSEEGKKLKKGKKCFARIGALPKDLGEGIQAKYNYSPVFEIQL